MKPNKIVFFDIDHTIYDPIKKNIPTSTLEAIKKLHARGDVYIGIATGRALYMLDVIESVKPFIDIYITINGQIIVHDNVIIHKDPLDLESILKVKAIFKAQELVYGYIGMHQQGINQLTQEAIHMFNDASMPLPIEDEFFYKKHDVYQMWAFANDQQFIELKEALKDLQLVPWLSDGFDVVLTDRSKKDGVEMVLNHLNIPLENAICFGDGDNDKEMLSYIPNSFAMGNSKDYIKTCAASVTDRYDCDGIYNALIKLNLITKE
ncbi:Cof-type HAD-IIB family hydrolase [Liberiplasma polymorphum]|uniref:Cof-type HAD-IIB family hydrolase n=1 Tax=Liberiplasma polymorphum TaxID=3374570 RepID=UPI00377645FE